MSPVQASFIIPLFNCLELTQHCVRTLRASLPRDLIYEIILVDDGSTDGTRAWLATCAPPIRVLLNPQNLGYAAANNRAAALASAPLLVFLNNDVRFRRGWWEPLRDLHESLGAHAGLVGNVQFDAASGALDHAGIYFNHQGKAMHLRSRPWTRWLPGGGARRIAALTGACFAVSRSVWRELEGFDEGYMNGSEDVDLCLRARAAGYINAVALRSAIEHHVSASPGRKRRDEANSRRFTQRWRDTLVHLAQRDVGRHYLEQHWTSPREPGGHAVARQVLFHQLGLARRPPLEIHAAATEAISRELARWDEMFSDK